MKSKLTIDNPSSSFVGPNSFTAKTLIQLYHQYLIEEYMLNYV